MAKKYRTWYQQIVDRQRDLLKQYTLPESVSNHMQDVLQKLGAFAGEAKRSRKKRKAKHVEALCK